MFAQPRRLRRFALQVLLVWVFGLASSVANACVDPSIWGHSGPTTYAQQGQLDTAHPALSEQASPEHEGCDHARVPCKQLCDGPSAVPHAEKQQVQPLNGVWLAGAPLPSFSFQTRAEEPELALASAPAPWRKSVPIPIAFLRLAL